MGNAMNLYKLVDYTGQLLQVERFSDYCPNGLQVEGRKEVRKIVTGVTASMALLEAARDARADMVLVHHGYFWRGEDVRMVGMKRNRVKFLLEHDISLLAYHLPLDAHPELGNNVQLGNRLGVEIEGWAGNADMVAYGALKTEMRLSEFSQHISVVLGRQPLLIGEPNRRVSRIAWCTGAAQNHFESILGLNVDVFVSGEISEQTVHIARETGIAYVAAGHHVTERYGVQALGNHLSTRFSLEHCFIDIDNPV